MPLLTTTRPIAKGFNSYYLLLMAICGKTFVCYLLLMALSHINGLGQRTSPYTQNNSSADEITNPVEDLGVGGHKT